jgi:hypothetical protein
MKKSGLVIGSLIFLTLVFYLLAYYLLPPPPPSVAMVGLFAAVAIVLVWALQWTYRKVFLKKTGHLLLLVAVMLCCYPAQAEAQRMSATCKFTSGPLAGTSQNFSVSSAVSVGDPCQDGAGSSGYVSKVLPSGSAPTYNNEAPSTMTPNDSAVRAPAPSKAEPSGGGPPPAAGAAPAPPPPPPPPPVEAARPAADSPSGPTMPRVTATAVLLPSQHEEQGYGLYSYALLTHRPQDSELPKYRAFLTALVGLPTAKDVGAYVRKARINITYFPLTSSPEDWDALAIDGRVDYVLAHYDYARGAAMLASLPAPIGTGPVITSVLKPLSYDQSPHPVLVQDLSKAQPVLMADYVKEFVDQAAQDHFWQERTLQAFSLHLRNFLETAAIGLGMSKDAVHGWVSDK